VQRTQKTTQQEQPAAASKLIDSVNECNILFNKNLYVKQKIVANNKHVIEEVSYHRVIIVASYY
jgi:hypothetical protein